jgi:TatD DNase family protein
MRLIDAHNHLQDKRLEGLLEDSSLASLAEAGIVGAVINGTHPEDWPAVAGIVEKMRQAPRLRLIPSYGLHPWKVKGLPSASSSGGGQDWLSNLEGHLRGDRGAHVGEVGLDGWIDRGAGLEQQREALLAQLELARRYDRVVSFHCLHAWGPFMELLRSHRDHLPSRGFLVHSPGASEEIIRELTAKFGALCSVSGYCCDPKKKKYQRMVAAVPPDHLLIETDAPDMLPPPGMRKHGLTDPVSGEAVNHPFNLPAVYEAVAAIREEPVEVLAERIATNFERLFGKLS